MKLLKVALICKNENSTKRNNRAMGYFSYDVPEFTWEHFVLAKNFTIDCKNLKEQGFDLIFHEDYPYGDLKNLGIIPYIFLSIDSTLSHDHFYSRFMQASKADLVLVDHDNLNRFKFKDVNTIQFPYCVNDKIFYRDDSERINDIAFHCSSSAHVGSDERKRIRLLLNDLAKTNNWSYRSGVLSIEDYAESFRTSKIVVNQTRTPLNRPHRIFDAMACGAMILTSPIPMLDNDIIIRGWDYETYHNDKDLNDMIWLSLTQKSVELPPYEYPYETISKQGYSTIMNNHTWSIRAKQLREIINKEFSL